MSQDNNSQSNWKDLMKNPLFWGMIITMLGVIGTNIKDVFIAGTEMKTTEIVVNVVKTDRDIDDHFRMIINQEIVKTMNDASTWLTVLESDMLAGYTNSQIEEVTEQFDRKIAEIDSAQHNLINDIGKMAGIRNDEFVKIFSSMIRDYRKDHIDMVHASF